MRDIEFRVDVLRDGATVTHLDWGDENPPTINAAKDAEIKSSMAGTFAENDDYNPIKDEIRPVLIVDGEEMPLGVFQAATVKESFSEFGKTMEIEAYDRCWRVQQHRVEGTHFIEKGTPYITAVQQLLTGAGVKVIFAEASDEKLKTDREDWTVGTDYLTICNQLLKEINFNPVYFDGNGACRVEKYQKPNTAEVKHKYSSRDAEVTGIMDERGQEMDVFSTPNVFIKICSNPDLDTPLVAVAENDAVFSKTSIINRGKRIANVEYLDNVASREELQALADKARNESMYATKTVTVKTMLEGNHVLGEIVAIDDEHVGGLYEQVGWSMQLTVGGVMEHTVRKVVVA